MNRFLRFACATFVVLSLTAACGDDGDETTNPPEPATVVIPQGSSIPGCEVTNSCYVPSNLSVQVGAEVTWDNNDAAAHTVTSGTPENGPDGNFNSSLFMAGTSFKHVFDTSGEFRYFCLIHPWMQGTVVVE